LKDISEKLCEFVTISEQQWGFLLGRSTTGAILSAVHTGIPIWMMELKCRLYSLICKKPWTVSHARLISKLSNLDSGGFRGGKGGANAPPFGG